MTLYISKNNSLISSVHIEAEKGSVISGKTTVVGDLPHGTQKPDIICEFKLSPLKGHGHDIYQKLSFRF